MSRVTVMRFLRLKHKITAKELAKAAGVSQQFVSDLELNKYKGRYDCAPNGAPLMLKAFESIANDRAREVRGLLKDLSANRLRLLQYMEENDEL
ncbi:MAG: helix-turn-helix domain-containing protein [Oscillospiraceae bacterium]|nr:helix-turn-helix domain-containing protein [Oscillospiraceae bacterium]